MSVNGFDNSGNSPIKVPGFGSLPIYLELRPEERFTHGANEWAVWPNLTARELAMLQVVETLTNKPDWHIKVFNNEIVARWRKEALEMPLISTKAWDWCMAELQDKAAFFEKTGRILVFNTGSGICKSDTLVTADLHAELRKGVAPLLAQPEAEKDWHPNSNQQVLNLVHPSLFPLVYGTTQVLTDGGLVYLDKPLNSCGRGSTAPLHPEKFHNEITAADDRKRLAMPSWTVNELRLCRWSTRFQWLPFEAEFIGESGTDVRITSYINNLHSAQSKSLYDTIEKVISLAIEPWNDILIKGMRGRWPTRIRTWGVEWLPEYPEWAADERLSDLEKDRTSKAYKETVLKIKEFLALPDRPEYANDPLMEIPEHWEEMEGGMAIAVSTKHLRLQYWIHPEPGTAFTYEDWKSGKTGKAIIKRTNRDNPDIYIPPDPDHEFYSVALQDTFRKQGLQIIVKLASIELKPEKPAYPGGSWHIEGMLNEHIVATAIYYYDVENVTDSHLAFRQESRMESDEYTYYSYDFEHLGAVFSIDNIEDMLDGPYLGGHPAIQNLGSVSTPQGRLLAWPNTLQHRVEPFKLVDESRPGHRRFIVLWLVDPHYRVCSTRNVPPQQHDWWAEDALAKAGFASWGMSQEIVDLIEKGTDEWPMGMNEAKQVRLDLMAERTVADRAMTNEGTHKYNFCEH